MAMDKDFIQWIHDVISPQADYGNNVSVSDYSKDGMTDFLYPVTFVVNGDEYMWSYGSHHTKGRHLCNHYELWFYGKAFKGSQKVATGEFNKSSLRKGLRIIYDYYNNLT